MSQVKIRKEEPGDEARIFEVVADAFPTDAEAQLVDLMRSQNDILSSLVALGDEGIIGHVVVSPIRIEGVSSFMGGIAPLSVFRAHQAKGVGSLLMEAAIEECRNIGLAALFLLGDPGYYTRFGFSRSHIGNEYGAEDGFMQLELQPDVLAGVSGVARYVDAFSESGT